MRRSHLKDEDAAWIGTRLRLFRQRRFVPPTVPGSPRSCSAESIFRIRRDRDRRGIRLRRLRADVIATALLFNRGRGNSRASRGYRPRERDELARRGTDRDLRIAHPDVAGRETAARQSIIFRRGLCVFQFLWTLAANRARHDGMDLRRARHIDRNGGSVRARPNWPTPRKVRCCRAKSHRDAELDM